MEGDISVKYLEIWSEKFLGYFVLSWIKESSITTLMATFLGFSAADMYNKITILHGIEDVAEKKVNQSLKAIKNISDPRKKEKDCFGSDLIYSKETNGM